MVSGFLIKDNFQHICGILKAYLNDSFNVDVSDAELSATVAQTMKSISSEKKPVDTLDALNKKVIVAVRDAFTKKKPPVPIVTKQASLYETRTQDTSTSNDEDAFIQKLRDVEIQRTTTDVLGTTQVATLSAAEEQVVSGTVVQNTAPSTIIVQNSGVAKVKMHVHVARSSDRLWLYQCNRNGFIYSGIETRSTKEIRVKHIVAPVYGNISQNGYFMLQIESAGHDIENVYVVPRTSHAKWMYLEPLCADGAELARVLSTPWTLTLCDSFGQPIDLGIDGWSISSTIVTQRGTTVCMLVNPLASSADILQHFSDGDMVQLHVIDTKQIITTTVVYTTCSSIEVAAIKIPSNAVVLNTSRQVSVFFTVSDKK